MPQLRTYDSILESVIADVKAVWTDCQRIHAGWPRIHEAKGKAYAVVALDRENPVAQSPDSVAGFNQTLNFTITRVAPIPADKQLVLQAVQLEKANALIARLERTPNYMAQDGTTGLGMWPVGNVGPIPEPVDGEQVYEVNVSFSVQVRELHTSRL